MYVLMYIYICKNNNKKPSVSKGWGEAWKEVEGGDITELKRRTGKVEVMSLYLS